MISRKKIKEHTFGLGLRYLVVDDFALAVKALTKEGFKELEAELNPCGLAGYEMIEGQATFFCIVTLDKSLIFTLKTMAHELFHITQDILEYNGVNYIPQDANEVYAHTYEYLFGEAYVHTVKAWNKKYGKITITKNNEDKGTEQQSAN